MSLPLCFVDSQDEEEMSLEPVLSPIRPATSVDLLQGIAKSIKGVRLSPDSGKAAASRNSPVSARRGVKTTPKARLRHDDSQIQFAAIGSSPLQPELVESQYLTDRQKEVKERQAREAPAMFPEIGSSPRNISRPIDYVLPNFVLKSTQIPTPISAIQEDASPMDLPDVLMNEFLGSSPTPSSKKSNDRRSEDDPPSSPPLISPQFQVNQLTDAPLALNDHTLVLEIANTEEKLSNRITDQSLPTTKGYLPKGGSVGGVGDDPSPINDEKDASNRDALQPPVEILPVSDFDIYVDAPSEPSLNKPSTAHSDIQPNDNANSFQSEGSSHFSVEDDQVTAQLITEMERASSQPSAKKNETAQSARGATNKRKRTADSSIVKNKKKRTPAPLDSQAAADRPGTGETVADCVMIDVREVDSSCPVLQPKIKRELSASPSILPSIQAIEETVVTDTPPVNHPVQSAANQSLDQERNTPSTAKKIIGRPRGSRNSQVKREETEKEHAGALRKSTRASKRLSGSTTSSPHISPTASQEPTKGGQWFALGKSPRRGMFRWLQRSSGESEDMETSMPTASSANENNAEEASENSEMQNVHNDDLSPAEHHPAHQSTSYSGAREFPANQRDDEVQVEEEGGIETEEEEATTAGGILRKFQSMLDDIKGVTFGAEEERAAIGMLFECVKEVHEAGRRHQVM